MLDQFDPNEIQDLEGARQAIIYLLNLVEEVVSELMKGSPSIAVGKTDTGLKVDVMLLNRRELRIAARRIREVLTPANLAYE